MDRMQFGSYLFPHNPRTIQVETAQKAAQLFLPRTGGRIQPLGPQCRRITCKGELFSDNPQATLKELSALAAAADGEVKTLFLPTGEALFALLEQLTYTADGDGRVIAYTAVFLEEAGVSR